MSIFNFLKKKETKTDDWVSRGSKEMIDQLLNAIKSNPQACNLDKIPQGFGEFGLDQTNPIPVYGIPSNKTYLNSLRSPNGEVLRYRRNGSIKVSNIVKPVDEYEIFNSAGDIIAKLYISPYHWKTSTKAPSGFKIKK